MGFIVLFVFLAALGIVGLIVYSQLAVDQEVRANPGQIDTGHSRWKHRFPVIGAMLLAVLAGIGIEWARQRRERLRAAQCRK